MHPLNDWIKLWRTHSCAQRSHSCERIIGASVNLPADARSDQSVKEWLRAKAQTVVPALAMTYAVHSDRRCDAYRRRTRNRRTHNWRARKRSDAAASR
jgi:hypothetical protein